MTIIADDYIHALSSNRAIQRYDRLREDHQPWTFIETAAIFVGSHQKGFQVAKPNK